jgi:hypothetical protein
MTFAMIGRCDPGGLGTLTSEVHRHLRPARTLLVDLDDRGRGVCHETPYVHGDIVRVPFAGAVPDLLIDWLCAPGVDVLWSAETFYDARILRAARANGVRTVVCAMPELAPWAAGAPAGIPSIPRPSLITVPTGWRHDTLPAAQLLPVPVATDRLVWQHRTRIEHLYHPTGTAMADRNGTDLLLAAVAHVTRPCRLTIRAERPITIPPAPNVDITVVTDPAGDYWAQYPPDIDLLVLPRRYGGLSLPVQECAALGVPALVLDPDPYAAQPWTVTVPATRSRPTRMKGGTVPVHQTSPSQLAAAIDRAIDRPDEHAGRSAATAEWVRTHAWDGPLGHRWCELLAADCPAAAA